MLAVLGSKLAQTDFFCECLHLAIHAFDNICFLKGNFLRPFIERKHKFVTRVSKRNTFQLLMRKIQRDSERLIFSFHFCLGLFVVVAQGGCLVSFYFSSTDSCNLKQSEFSYFQQTTGYLFLVNRSRPLLTDQGKIRLLAYYLMKGH